MIGSDGYIDGSWKLKVFVTDLGVERELRVKGDLHIGGVLLRLVEDLGKFRKCQITRVFLLTPCFLLFTNKCQIDNCLTDSLLHEQLKLIII